MKSYKQIAKSSGIIGFVSILQMSFSLLRNKVIALILGAKGFGVYGMYQVFIETAITFGSLGLEKSGVRYISKNRDNLDLRNQCIYVFTRSVFVVSLFISIICSFFSKAISRSLFDTEDYYIGVVICCLVVFLRCISQGQTSILNGLRDLRSLALSQILAASVGSVLSVAFVYFLGFDGLALSFLSFAVASLIFSFLFLRKHSYATKKPTFKEFTTQFKDLIYLGLGFSVAGAIASLFIYLSRTYINSEFSLDVVGIYQACWLISNLYIGIILNAMGVDFMPRLMSVIGNKKEVNRLVNEQMEIGTLLSGIGVVFIICYSDIILQLLYSAEFAQGADIIRWQVLGVALRVLGFPLAHSVMAYNKPFMYVLIQGVFALVEYLLLMYFTNTYGFDGLGINYFAAYIVFMIMWMIATNYLFNFRFSRKLIYIMLFTWTGIAISNLIVMFTDGMLTYVLGAVFGVIYFFIINGVLKRFMELDLFSMIAKRIRK